MLRLLFSIRHRLHFFKAVAVSLFASLVLSGCQEQAEPVSESGPHPALWEIRSDGGQLEGWLFGTIHALPGNTVWRSPLFNQTMDQADMLVVEVANLEDGEALTGIFEDLAFDSPTGPITDRIDQDLADEFDALLVKGKVRSTYFDPMESWAAALALSQVAQSSQSENGVDRSLLRQFEGREVVELEGARKQLEMFDALPETEQRDLLNAILVESAEYGNGVGELALSWQRGDTETLTDLLLNGTLSDPELRQALLVERNRAWSAQIENLLSASSKPFIAVGAGHMLGNDGLPDLLERRGFRIRRIQ